MLLTLFADAFRWVGQGIACSLPISCTFKQLDKPMRIVYALYVQRGTQLHVGSNKFSSSFSFSYFFRNYIHSFHSSTTFNHRYGKAFRICCKGLYSWDSICLKYTVSYQDRGHPQSYVWTLTLWPRKSNKKFAHSMMWGQGLHHWHCSLLLTSI